MPRKKNTNKAAPNGVCDFRHAGVQRKNNPPVGIAYTYEIHERQTSSYNYDPRPDPQLQCACKAEHMLSRVDVVSLRIHEKISARAILDAVRHPAVAQRAVPLQMNLFGETTLPADQEVQFYQHEVGWANRLILGNSLLMTNSFLVKEGMAGKVQMSYNPLYGIKYAFNFQPHIDCCDVKDKHEDLTHKPEAN